MKYRKKIHSQENVTMRVLAWAATIISNKKHNKNMPWNINYYLRKI